MLLSNANKNSEKLSNFDGDIDRMQNSLLKSHLLVLREVKANLLLNKVKKWLSESQDKTFEYRFNGETSCKVGSNYHRLVEHVKNPQHRAFLSHAGCLLRDISAMLGQVHVQEDYADTLKQKCRQYYIIKSLLGEAKLSDWTLAYAVPHHATEIYGTYNAGYGLISMQGREAKHQRVKAYIQKTKRDVTTWPKAFKHEYISTVYLPLERCDPRDFTSKQQRKSEKFVRQLDGDQCKCGFTLVNQKCPSCTSPYMEQVKLSCAQKAITNQALAFMNK